ncbi:MAG: hypothetical protein Q7R66_18395 [Undibacterium sp.]|uniref:hypothetical protein n=1 Tax=Undibacterium sp. TaxID=1914977 RepID=UPI00271A77D4|nr:hypothetical protein [Undibacterium sp.]MDO8654146.1 hypothetical protein [Undibacterium sp.]
MRSKRAMMAWLPCKFNKLQDSSATKFSENDKDGAREADSMGDVEMSPSSSPSLQDVKNKINIAPSAHAMPMRVAEHMPPEGAWALRERRGIAK